jgi:hypothetical protein
MRRIAPAVGLFFLAPFVGEYVLGNIPISMFIALPFLAPMYGGGALLIRETGRRTGRTWPAILVLALAYGLLEPALLDQSLFNRSFDSFVAEDQGAATLIPALGISAGDTLSFVVGHAIWSISVPIVFMETLARERRTTPWLGKVGLVVTSLIFVFGSWIIFNDQRETEGFMATPTQRISSALVVLALVAIAFAIGRANTPPTSERRMPRPRTVGVLAFIASSVFIARPETWGGVAFGIVLLVVAAAVIVRWSRQRGWTDVHRFALAAGALLTYVWLGFVLTLLRGEDVGVALIGNAIFGAMSIILIVVAAGTQRPRATFR